MSAHVIYAANQYGYCCQVIEGGEVVYEYHGGNCALESTTYVDLDDPHALSLRRLKKCARQTARELAREYKAESVEWDDDLHTELEELLTSHE